MLYLRSVHLRNRPGLLLMRPAKPRARPLLAWLGPPAATLDGGSACTVGLQRSGGMLYHGQFRRRKHL